MKRVLLGIAAALVLIVGGVLTAAAFQPKEFHIERSIETSASPAAIYAVISDLHRFAEWSPWQKLDPGMQTEFTGPQTGVGSALSWKGNKDVGTGRMTIVGAQPDKGVDLKLEFLEPMVATNQARWQIDEANGQRRITWSMDGRNDALIPRVFCMFMNMDKMVGSDFEKGLAALKTVVERG